MKRTLLASVVALLIAGVAHSATPVPPTPQKITDGVWLIPGSYPPDRQPDGNTIVWRAKGGLIVMDTGRHTWHRRAILDFAKAQNLPVIAIINSHWHLDHNSGNRDIKAAYPGAKIYTGTAVERMIRDFFPASVERSKAYLAAGNVAPVEAEEIQGDIDTRSPPDALKPDVAITGNRTFTFGGRALELRVAPNAATDGDVWVYDARTHIAATGDLITLPVPFLDTACVKGWRAGLDAVAATPFTVVIPGHGAPMTRAQFLSYKAAFDAYVNCAQGSADKAVCTEGWLKSTADLRAPEAPDDARATAMAGEYVDFLRQNGGNGMRCLVP